MLTNKLRTWFILLLSFTALHFYLMKWNVRCCLNMLDLILYKHLRTWVDLMSFIMWWTFKFKICMPQRFNISHYKKNNNQLTGHLKKTNICDKNIVFNNDVSSYNDLWILNPKHILFSVLLYTCSIPSFLIMEIIDKKIMHTKISLIKILSTSYMFEII